MENHAIRRFALAVALAAGLMLSPIHSPARAADGPTVQPFHGLSSAQRADLRNVARDTWRFYNVDIDPSTNLPMDNVTFANGSSTPTAFGRYTSASNIGVYLWAVVAAHDLGLITRAEAHDRIAATLTEVQHLKRFNGFLYQWYDTSTGDRIRNPGDADCSTETTPTYDNCFFISQVDN